MAPQVLPAPGDKYLTAIPRPLDTSALVDLSVSVAGRAHATIANAINFAMGMAWLALTSVVATESFSSEPTRASAGKLWTCAAVASVILIPVMYALARLSAKFEQDSQEAMQSGNHVRARRRCHMAKSVQTVSSWGCAFGLAGQLSLAAAASVPASPWLWRLAYTVVITLIVVAASAFVAAVGKCVDYRKKRVLRCVANDIVSGAAYSVALGFLNTAIAAFKLNDLTTSKDLGYLAVFVGVTLVVTTVGLSLLIRIDAGAVRKASEAAAAAAASAVDGYGNAETKSATVADTQRSLPAPPIWVQQLNLTPILRKLAAKTLSMCAVVAMHALLYVSLECIDLFGTGPTASIYDPLPIQDAAIFLLISLLAAIVGGAIVQRTLLGAAERLSLVDRAKVPGPFDDALLGSLQALAQCTLSTVMVALGWLVGYGVHGCAASVWELTMIYQEETAQVPLAAAYACLATAVAFAFTICCAPIPTQSA